MNPFQLNKYSDREPSEKQQKRFPGWFALDFGTSNSTVTLFDPIEVPIAEILPKEQEMRLRESLITMAEFSRLSGFTRCQC